MNLSLEIPSFFTAEASATPNGDVSPHATHASGASATTAQSSRGAGAGEQWIKQDFCGEISVLNMLVPQNAWVYRRNMMFFFHTLTIDIYHENWLDQAFYS